MKIACVEDATPPQESQTAPKADPVLTFGYIRGDLGCSYTTFFRVIRPQLPVVQISPRRLGVRKSDYETFKQSLIRAPGQAA